jgi:hypothetical protein
MNILKKWGRAMSKPKIKVKSKKPLLKIKSKKPPLKVKDSKPKRIKLKKLHKIIINNPEECFDIINKSIYYNSTFEDPFKTGINKDSINYRCTLQQREQIVQSIVDNDPRIYKVKQHGKYVIISCKNQFTANGSNPIRYMIFEDERRKGEFDAGDKSSSTKKEKRHTTNDKNKLRTKKRGRRKSKRK